MLHVPEQGQHMVRHYGLYGSACRDRRNRVREKIGGLLEGMNPETGASVATMLICKGCGGQMQFKQTIHARHRKGNSYREWFDAGHVQQDDETDQTQAKKISRPLRL